MQKTNIPTPDGVETVYDELFLANYDLLKERVTPLVESFSALPITAALAQRMLPDSETAWSAVAIGYTLYIEVTPYCLTAPGLSVDLTELSSLPPLSSALERWGFALALAEELRRSFPRPTAWEVCPLYTENALCMAVENPRSSAGLRLAEDIRKSREC